MFKHGNSCPGGGCGSLCLEEWPDAMESTQNQESGNLGSSTGFATDSDLDKIYFGLGASVSLFMRVKLLGLS